MWQVLKNGDKCPTGHYPYWFIVHGSMFDMCYLLSIVGGQDLNTHLHLKSLPIPCFHSNTAADRAVSNETAGL